MKRPRLCMLDLDGTLVDTSEDLAESVNALRAGRGLPRVTVRRVVEWVGDGAPVLVARALGVPEEKLDRSDEAREGLAFFREHYTRHMMDRARPYPGVVEAIDRLREAGVELAVVSNKPRRMCEEMLESLELVDRFELVLGGDSLPTPKPDPAPLIHAMRERSVEPADAVMVGDGAQDVLAGRAAKVTTVAALYGFRSREELEEAGPDHWIARPAELAELLLAGV